MQRAHAAAAMAAETAFLLKVLGRAWALIAICACLPLLCERLSPGTSIAFTL